MKKNHFSDLTLLRSGTEQLINDWIVIVIILVIIEAANVVVITTPVELDYEEILKRSTFIFGS